jgi:hypothetical protein
MRGEVRRVRVEPGLPPPPGGGEFQMLRDESVAEAQAIVFRAPTPAWDTVNFGPGVSVERMSLEDIFLAFAAASRVQL